MRLSVFKPAVTATGLPESVPALYTEPSGARCAIISRRPPKAASGKPPPIIFPRQVKSGLIPYRDCAPPSATRKPDRKSTRLNSSHQIISYAVFCLKKKKKNKHHHRPNNNTQTHTTQPKYKKTT